MHISLIQGVLSPASACRAPLGAPPAGPAVAAAQVADRLPAPRTVRRVRRNGHHGRQAGLHEPDDEGRGERVVQGAAAPTEQARVEALVVVDDRGEGPRQRVGSGRERGDVGLLEDLRHGRVEADERVGAAYLLEAARGDRQGAPAPWGRTPTDYPRRMTVVAPSDPSGAAGAGACPAPEPAASLRPATRADCPAILAVMFSTAMSRESTWWRTTVGGLETRLAEGGGFVAVDGDTIIGCVMHVREGDRLALRGLAVRPEAEGQGIGSALVSAVESVAVADGLAEVLLAVSASNLEVSDFYRRLGYTDSDEPYAHAAAGRPAPAVLVKRLPSPTARPTSRP